MIMRISMEHVALYVNDLEGAKEFFVKYFNASHNEMYHNAKTGFSSYFLTFDSGARLEIMNIPDMENNDKSLRYTGYAHIAFSLGSTEEVDKLAKRFREDGYTIKSGPRITGDGYYESCICGFEGNIIELTV